ncbi:TetR/AcrR family transcriptional regulator [Frankia sp. AgB1.9]|uniref:TetR/AcrR family transcriptional regulator n=1 Tax=unclassified Frankia TaxID=2632575 RepID=UPI0019324A4D|nr:MULTISPECIES: TetR/AcrR family transcriptional regulator [unclassified Frankia]MBL7548713.1 TetR/AcrR family transcriptional regulator [Frankia sp. AgB1.9]
MAVDAGGPPARRVRRTPTVARREILEAARAVLEDGQAADFTVASVMSRTGMTRKTFYVHFADRAELIRELVAPLRADLDASMRRWSGAADPLVAGTAALAEAARMYTTHATLLRAVWWSAAEDAEVDRARTTLLEPLVTVGAKLLVERRGFDGERARAVARALAMMNVHVLLSLGPTPTDPEISATTDALGEVWTSVVLRGDTSWP